MCADFNEVCSGKGVDDRLARGAEGEKDVQMR